MILATVTSSKTVNGQYGQQVESLVNIDGGTTAKVWTKADIPFSQQIKPGVRVELEPKNNGKGYIIKSIVNTPAPIQQKNGSAPPAQKQEGMSKKDIADFISTKAGHYAYAYEEVQRIFDERTIIVTEETLRAAAATVVISLDKHIRKDYF